MRSRVGALSRAGGWGWGVMPQVWRCPQVFVASSSATLHVWLHRGGFTGRGACLGGLPGLKGRHGSSASAALSAGGWSGSAGGLEGGFPLLSSAGGAGAKVLDKAREDKAQGILVVPDWPGSMMAREIEYCEQLELVARWRPLFECSAWFKNSTFRGWPKFDGLAFRMRF